MSLSLQGYMGRCLGSVGLFLYIISQPSSGLCAKLFPSFPHSEHFPSAGLRTREHRGEELEGGHRPGSTCCTRCGTLTRVPFAGIEMEIVNSCETNNGGCSHMCHHTSSGPVCTCNFGYRLEEDQKTCTGKAREKVPTLVLTNKSSHDEDLCILCSTMLRSSSVSHYKQVTRARDRCRVKGDEVLLSLKTTQE